MRYLMLLCSVVVTALPAYADHKDGDSRLDFYFSDATEHRKLQAEKRICYIKGKLYSETVPHGEQPQIPDAMFITTADASEIRCQSSQQSTNKPHQE